MSYTIHLDGAMAEVRYQGRVSFSERMQAVAELEEVVKSRRLERILVDFSQAELYEDSATARIDYTSVAIATPALAHCCLAVVSMPQEHAKLVTLTGLIRGMQLRVFDTRDDAVVWLEATRIAGA